MCWGLTVWLIELLKSSSKQNWSSQVHLGSECVQLLGSLCTAFPVYTASLWGGLTLWDSAEWTVKDVLVGLFLVFVPCFSIVLCYCQYGIVSWIFLQGIYFIRSGWWLQERFQCQSVGRLYLQPLSRLGKHVIFHLEIRHEEKDSIHLYGTNFMEYH